MVEERKYTFTISDIETMVRRGLMETGMEDFVFHWNFDIDKPQPVNSFSVLTVESKNDLGDAFDVNKVK